MNDEDEQFVEDEDEVLTPDEVSGPRTVRRASGGKAPLPDRFGRWSMFAGLGSLLLLVLFPVLVVVLALACAGIYFGMRTRRQLEDADEPEKARKRARIGTAAGGLTIVVLMGLILYFNFVYDSPEKVNDFNTDKTTEPG